MPEITVRLKLENSADLYQQYHGLLRRKRVRGLEVEALVDLEVMETVLPSEFVEKLGLRRVDRGRAGPIFLTIGNRSMDTDCRVGRRGTRAVVGQLVMTGLDLIADANLATLTPRPESPDGPTLGMRAGRVLEAASSPN